MKAHFAMSFASKAVTVILILTLAVTMFVLYESVCLPQSVEGHPSVRSSKSENYLSGYWYFCSFQNT